MSHEYKQLVKCTTRVSYNNAYPWFTTELGRLRLQEDQAFKSGDVKIHVWQRLYSERLQQQFSADDSVSVWRGLRLIIRYKPKDPYSRNNLHLANKLNDRVSVLNPSTAFTPHSHTFPANKIEACASQQFPTSSITSTPLSILERAQRSKDSGDGCSFPNERSPTFPDCSG